ncbi:MAG: hypothetical protein HS117_00215 [Verrucomicrobiaceae bacterium]|jgi:hypothetical protein|nr:hypothetical protein [Verrucomicrobiaceae bacterium]
MEYAKFWVLLFFVSVVAGGFTLQQHFQAVDRLNAEVLSIRGNVGQTNSSTDRLKQEWAKVEVLVQRLQAANAKNASLQQQRDELKVKLRSLEGDFKYLLSSVRDAVDKVRANAPGEVYDEVVLADGRVLKSAKIRKVEDAQISFIHSEGISAITHDMLPESIRSRFDLAPDGLLASLKQTDQELLAPPPVAASKSSRVAVSTSSSGSSSSDSGVVDEAKVKSIKLKMIDIDAKIASLRNSADSYDSQAADLYISGDMAKSRGTPASRYWTAAENAKRQAQVLRSQIIGLESEKQKLQVDLDAASKRR